MAAIQTLGFYSNASFVSLYKLEDTSDSKASNTLTNHNSVTFTAARYNNGANLGSGNTNKYLSTTQTFVDGGAFSVLGWVKLLSEIASGTYTLFWQANNTSQTSFRIRYKYNGGSQTLDFTRSKGGIGEQGVIAYASGALGTSIFHHLALTYDGSTVTGYLDGKAVGTGAASGNGNTSDVNGFAIGMRTDGSSDPTSAIFDDVGVASFALTANDISQVYRDGGGFFALL